MTKGLRKKYELLRKKHKLPGFEELDSEFEISALDTESLSPRELRRKISEKIDDVALMLERALHPDTNLADLYESRVFDESEKQELFEIYKKMMAFARQTAELMLDSNEKLEASFINSFYSEWKKLKPQLLRHVTKLKESWQKETEKREAAGYMG